MDRASSAAAPSNEAGIHAAADEDQDADRLPLRVALLSSFIAPYRIPLFRSLGQKLADLSIFISTPMEPNRDWPVEWHDLNVVCQRNLTVHKTWSHPKGFRERQYIQVPYDTIFRLRTYKPDVIVTDELGLRTLQTVAYRAFSPRTGIVAWLRISEHSEQGRGRLRPHLRRRLLPRADAVLVHGQSAARYVKQYSVPSEQVFIVGQAVEASPAPAAAKARDWVHPQVLLYAGRLVELKGIVPFLGVLRRWGGDHPDRSLEFWVAGDGPLSPEIANFALPANVTLKVLGSVPYEELPGVYAQADLFVLPTLCDEWGLVVNEAMTAGLPVIGSLYSQAVEELLTDGVNGWTFYPDREESAYDAVRRALSISPDDHARMAQAAKDRIARLTIADMADGMLSAIRYASDRRRPGGRPLPVGTYLNERT